MNSLGYITVKAAVNEYLKQVDPDDEIDRTRIKSFANNVAREFIIADVQDVKVIPLVVDNYGVSLPDDFNDVIQILYRTCKNPTITREVAVEWVQECFGTGCKLRITKECPKCRMNDACSCGLAPVIIADHNWNDLHAFERVNDSKFYNYGQVIGSGFKNKGKLKESQWGVLERTTNNFHSLKYDTNDNCNLPDTSTRPEYDIRDRRIITSFKTGELLLAYLGNKIDDEGYYMIPDHPEAINAVVYSIMASDALRMYSKSPSQTTRIYWSDMTQLSKSTLNRAISKLNFTSYDKLKAAIKTYWSQVVTNHGNEYNLGRFRPDQYKPNNWKY